MSDQTRLQFEQEAIMWGGATLGQSRNEWGWPVGVPLEGLTHHFKIEHFDPAFDCKLK